MERSIMTILVILISLGPILAQDNEELEEYGFIEIKTDSMNVPFFIDGYYEIGRAHV